MKAWTTVAVYGCVKHDAGKDPLDIPDEPCGCNQRNVEGHMVEVIPLKWATELHELLEQITDPDPCWYDHHGYCQAHYLHEKPCPVGRAQEILGIKE